MKPYHETLKERSDKRHRQNCAAIPGGELAVKKMVENIWPLYAFYRSLGPIRRQIGNISGITFSRFVHKGVAPTLEEWSAIERWWLSGVWIPF